MIGVGEFPAADHRVGGVAQWRLLRHRGGAITPGYGRADDRAAPKSQAICVHAGTLARPSCSVMGAGRADEQPKHSKSVACYASIKRHRAACVATHALHKMARFSGTRRMPHDGHIQIGRNVRASSRKSFRRPGAAATPDGSTRVGRRICRRRRKRTACMSARLGPLGLALLMALIGIVVAVIRAGRRRRHPDLDTDPGAARSPPASFSAFWRR